MSTKKNYLDEDGLYYYNNLITGKISAKANSDDVYTKTEIDTKFDGIDTLLEAILHGTSES